MLESGSTKITNVLHEGRYIFLDLLVQMQLEYDPATGAIYIYVKNGGSLWKGTIDEIRDPAIVDVLRRAQLPDCQAASANDTTDE